ncbi:hypothetical protein POF50_011170 [Streptomyces sp. SL13]|uniref:Bacterial transcriptional activator domain-containing protein n=1 Tax=Streptantibioticus silvisoli TaxID=2705255 RepID=A0AA90H362_9ACTN|nr:hypothetical protein [Streptantibioticus silvisoli]MDI5969889.1 hypothetical protein [Streptantibioticus silvisoli]
MLCHPGAPRRIAHTVGALMRSLLALAVLAVLLVGLPWGLMRFVGWPLPHAVPGWSGVETVLLSPMSTLFLLHLLACVLWPVWALFAWDVARSVADLVHGGPWVRRPNLGPVHALATALVATAVVSLLARTGAVSPAAAGQRAVDAVVMPPAVTATMAIPETAVQHHAVPGTVEVRAPEGGVYDSMWRIAKRSLGQGDRWPEIYRLNRGVTQSDGRTLTNPNLIRPGWVFRLPGNEHAVTPPHRPSPRRSRATVPKQRVPSAPTASASRAPEPASRPSTATSTSATPSPSQTVPHAEPSAASRPPGIALPSGGYVGLGLAALVSAALVAVRLRRRRKYRPGSGGRDDLTIAPVVRALRIAHDTTLSDGPAEPEPPAGNAYPPPVAAPVPVPPVPAPVASSGPAVGECDGRALAWDLAAAHGLGLVGPGSLDAARALLTTQLAERMDPSRTPGVVVLPEPDARLLLGDDVTSRPAWLRVPATLNETLDVLEQELLDRAAQQVDTNVGQQVILVATPVEWADRRVQSLLENGAAFGLTAVLLGQWRAGTTAHVRPDGTVSAARPDSELTGARLFTLPEADTRELLELLAEATGSPAGRTAAEPPVLTQSANPTPREPDDRQPSAEQAPAPEVLPRRPKATTTVRTAADPRRPASPAATPEDLHRLLGALKEPQAPPTTRAAVAMAPARAMTLRVLGRVQLLHHTGGGEAEVDVTSALAPKHREILTYLALHRAGVRREALTASIWPDARRDRPFNSFHATLSQMRKAIRTVTENAVTDIAHQDDGTYVLDAEQLTVDLWNIEDALRSGRPEHDDDVLQRVLDTYRGDLAPELAAEWLDVPREALRREVLDAVTNRARTVRPEAPARALVLLEHARALDRYNEAVYCDIGCLQAELGQADAVGRTYALLKSTLQELDDEPATETLEHFTSLARPQRASRTVHDRRAG